jgi:hypothetical protein
MLRREQEMQVIAQSRDQSTHISGNQAAEMNVTNAFPISPNPTGNFMFMPVFRMHWIITFSVQTILHEQVNSKRNSLFISEHNYCRR